MKPFHLQVQCAPQSEKLHFQWFGQSAIRAHDSCDLLRSPQAPAALVADTFLIDLNPLLAEIAAGAIADAEAFQAADEFLWLRELLADDDFEALCETLYHFLWQEAPNNKTPIKSPYATRWVHTYVFEADLMAYGMGRDYIDMKCRIGQCRGMLELTIVGCPIFWIF